MSNFTMGTISGMGFSQAQVHTNHSTSAKKSNIYLEVIGTRHVHSVNFNDLITGTQSSILSNEAIREDFLDYNTSLQITEIHFHLLHWYEYRAAINFSRYVHGYFLGMIGTVIYKAGIKFKQLYFCLLAFLTPLTVLKLHQK